MSNLSTFLQVYRGILPAGQLIAIKRAQTESLQGGVEFKTEIELLSRVHHKNLVSLVGFCFDQGEQMLVYEYVPNGTLMDGLSGTSILFLTFFYLIEFLYLLALEVEYFINNIVELLSLLALYCSLIKELRRRQYILFLLAKETKKSHGKNQ